MWYIAVAEFKNDIEFLFNQILELSPLTQHRWNEGNPHRVISTFMNFE